MIYNKFIPYFIKKNFLTEEECNEIIRRGLDSEEFLETSSYNKKKNRFFEFQNNEVIFKKISDLIYKVNNKYYKYDMEISNAVELYKYETGDFFDYHMDLYKGIASRRKLTFLILLSDPYDYLGGRLHFLSNSETDLPKVRGTIAIYPSFIMHKVTKVESGIRYSLGGECVGEPFR